MKKLIIILILSVFVSIAIAAIDSVAKRKAAQIISFIPNPPIPDGTIDAADRAALAGVYGIGLFSDDIGRAGQDAPGRNYRRSRYR